MKPSPKRLAVLISMIGMGIVTADAVHARDVARPAVSDGRSPDEAREIARVRAILGLDEATPPAPIVTTRLKARAKDRPAHPVPELMLPILAEVTTLSNAPKLTAAAPLARRRSSMNDVAGADDDDGRAMTAWLADLTVTPTQPARRDEPPPMLVEATPIVSRRESGRDRDSLLPALEPHVAADVRDGETPDAAPTLMSRGDADGQVIGYDDQLLELLKVLDGFDGGQGTPSPNAIAIAPAASTPVDVASPEPGAQAFASIAREIGKLSIEVDRDARATALASPPMAARFVAPSRSDQLSARLAVMPLLAKHDGASEPRLRRLPVLPRVPLVDLDPTIAPVEQLATADLAGGAKGEASAPSGKRPIVRPIRVEQPIVVANPTLEPLVVPRIASASSRDDVTAIVVEPLPRLASAASTRSTPSRVQPLLPRVPLAELGPDVATTRADALPLLASVLKDDRSSDRIASRMVDESASKVVEIRELRSVRSADRETGRRDRERSTPRDATTIVADGGSATSSAWFDIFDAALGARPSAPRAANAMTGAASSSSAGPRRRKGGIVIASSLGERVTFAKVGDALMPPAASKGRAEPSVVVARDARPRLSPAVVASDARLRDAVPSVEEPSIATASTAGPIERPNPLQGQLVALADEQLDTMRAGFETPNGLQISFGIERAVYINGALVTTQSLNVADLGRMTAGQALQGAGVERATLGLIQNGPNNTFNAAQAGASGVATVIQNTLDNQKIQGVTLINATVNSADLAKRADLTNSIQNAVTGSIRR